MALPPYKHEKVFIYPRWHPHDKVVQDLELHGKVCNHSASHCSSFKWYLFQVRLYHEFPDDDQARQYKETIMLKHKEMLSIVQNSANSNEAVDLESKQPESNQSKETDRMQLEEEQSGPNVVHESCPVRLFLKI